MTSKTKQQHPERVMKAARAMLGKGWFSTKDLHEYMGKQTHLTAKTLQAVRRSPDFLTEDEKRGGKLFVKVLNIQSDGDYLSKEKAFFRAVVFGDKIPSEFLRGAA